jgi:hypothetical protein
LGAARRQHWDVLEREFNGRIFLLAAPLLAATSAAFAQDSDHDLAKKLNNPVASLVSVPLQFNYDCCFKPAGSDRVTLNIQPVMPFGLTQDWNLIVRTILPVIAQPSAVTGGHASFGFGDTTQSFFFSPNAEADGFIWALGPAFLWPTATEPALGSHKWGAGPTGLLLKQEGGWTVGMLANHIWSYGGEREYPGVNNTFLQPFLSYTWPDTTNLGLNTESTYNWQSGQWTVPINLTAGHLFSLGGQRINFTLGGRYFPERPHDGASWGLRFVMTFLFPK